MPLKRWPSVLTCAVFVGGVSPAVAHAQPVVPFPPYGIPLESIGSAARLQVTPRETEVYVDGRLAGKVGDFEGFGKKLDLPSGSHEVTLYLEGYRVRRDTLNLSPGATYKITWSMEKLGAGETMGPRPEPKEPPRGTASAMAGPRPAAPPPAERPPDHAGFGTLRIRVQPQDATVLIDGERWDGPEAGRRLSVQVSEGRHLVEIRKDGYRTFSTSVRVLEGEVTPLNVSLPSQEPR